MMDAHSLVESQFDVPCDRCIACCTGQRVTMLPGDDASKYDMVEGWDGQPNLRNKPNGDCTYLVRTAGDRGHCSIWENRPVMCKEFDCRDMVKWLHEGKVMGMAPAIREAGERLIQIRIEKDSVRSSAQRTIIVRAKS